MRTIVWEQDDVGQPRAWSDNSNTHRTLSSGGKIASVRAPRKESVEFSEQVRVVCGLYHKYWLVRRLMKNPNRDQNTNLMLPCRRYSLLSTSRRELSSRYPRLKHPIIRTTVIVPCAR